MLVNVEFKKSQSGSFGAREKGEKIKLEKKIAEILEARGIVEIIKSQTKKVKDGK